LDALWRASTSAELQQTPSMATGGRTQVLILGYYDVGFLD
jgi:hypothetical protein